MSATASCARPTSRLADLNPTEVSTPAYAFLQSVTHSGYGRNGSGYDKRSVPPVGFEYTRPTVQETVEQVDAPSLENLPAGLDGGAYRWIDLHGEGVPGILAEQAGTWFYKRNMSPLPVKSLTGIEPMKAKFARIEWVTLKPNVNFSGGAEIMDLAGDGQPDVVIMEGPTLGLYEHDEGEDWQPFRPFSAD